MLIKYIKARNYKTYKDLNLNLEVEDGKSIILIGGKNMCGKTTLFDAIGGALYGLTIKNANQYKALVNYSYGADDQWKDQEIELEIMFVGQVLGQPKQYKLRRLYKLINDQVVENIRLDFDGNTYQYGTHTPEKDRKDQEENVNKIIKANLPPELREYFLFDALKVGMLVEQNQIDALIKDNIRSVMGFNKYLMLKEAAQQLLEEANAARLDNDQQREEYQNLLASISTCKSELEILKTEKDKALSFSVDNNDLYKSLLSGQKSDAGLKEKMEKARSSINNIVDDEKKFNQRIKEFLATLETDVFIPKVASVIAEEAAVIITKKEAVAEKKKGLLTDKQIESVTRQIIDIINKEYNGNGSISVDFVAKRVKEIQAESVNVDDEYYYLSDEDTNALTELITTRYGNVFAAIDRDRISLDQRVSDIPKLHENIETYKAQLAGDDYSLIKKYEENEERLKQLKLDITAKEREIQQKEDKLEQFDFEDNKNTDIKYETLKKLPALFDTLSERLLAARKSVIEQNMKDHLNKLIEQLEGMVGKVVLNINKGDISFKIYHIKGNEIVLEGLSAAGKQILIQLLLKELRDHGDYDPPVMIDSVMANFDGTHRKKLLEYYFPHLATQAILFSNDIDITPDENGYGKLRPYIAKTYLLNHHREEQFTSIDEGYFNNYK